MAKVTVNAMVDWTWEQIENVDADTLRGASYGIKYISLGDFYTKERAEKLSTLQEKLEAVESADKAKQTEQARHTAAAIEIVEADCGHIILATNVMTTSRGSSCPACYDRMSL